MPIRKPTAADVTPKKLVERSHETMRKNKPPECRPVYRKPKATIKTPQPDPTTVPAPPSQPLDHKMSPPSQLPVRIHQRRKEPPIQPLPIPAPIPDQSEDHIIRPTPNRYYAPEEMALDPYLDVERIVFDPNVDTNSPFEDELDYVEEEYRTPPELICSNPSHCMT